MVRKRGLSNTEEAATTGGAGKAVSKESEIPASTLDKWKYPRERVAGNGDKSKDQFALFLKRAKAMAKLANKLKTKDDFTSHKKELLEAAALIINVLTETREDIRWVR